MIRSGHVDTFARDNLPPQAQWPEFKLTLPELQYPDRLNCVTEYVDKWVAGGEGDRVAIISPTETLTYAQLAERINRIANVLSRDLGMVPGNRVLMRSPNSPMGIAVYLNFFVFVTQLFFKVPALHALAPNAPDNPEPPFLIAQVVVLAIFVWLIWKSVKNFRPAAA